jgi:hypothetical protein
MAIEVKSLGQKRPILRTPDGDWRAKPSEPSEEITATGKDVQALRGMLQPAIDAEKERLQRSIDKYGKVRLRNPVGQIEERIANEEPLLRSKGWGQQATNATFVVPALPWQKKRKVVAAGRRKWRYIDGELKEVK